ncbi:MAG: hypothetical protein LAT53_10675 [Idiomarina sp.]|nr:hypothetical protein [Idiomarina sp.]
MSFRKIVIEAICSISDRKFDVNEVREICKSSYPSMTHKQLHSNVYKYIWGLKQDGYLECHVNEKNNRKNLYAITPLGCQKLGLAAQPASNDGMKTETAMPEIKRTLMQKLSDYSSELAAHSAEVKEYQELSHQFPQLTPILQNSYQGAKERAVRLQGRVTALESAIQELGS